MPKMVLKRCWKRPRMPVKMEVMALTTEPTKSARELVTEGILNLLIRSDIGFCEIETVFELEKS